MSGRTGWTHEEIKAVADGDLTRFASLSRRRVLQGGLAAAGVMAMPIIPGPAKAAVGGDLITLTWEGFDAIDSTKEWATANGVTITNSSMATQDDVQAKLIGSNPVRLDVTSYNQAYNKFYADELQIINALDPAKLPNYNEADIFDAFYKKDRWFWDNTLWGLPFCWGLVALVYNPKMMAKPTSYKDLLAPELKGKIAFVDDNTGTWPGLAKVAGVNSYPNVTKEELTTIFENAKLYREQTLSFAPSNGDVVSLFVAGEIAACFCIGTNITVDTARQGVVTEYVVPEEGAFMWSDALCIPKSSGNIDTAYAFINEVMGPGPQAAIAQRNICGSPSRKAAEVMDDATRALFDYANLDGILKQTPLLGIPPRESADIATYDEWVQAYENLKVGI